MRYAERGITTALILLFVCTTIGYGQQKQAETDSSFNAYINNAWDDIRKASSSERDSLQEKYSKELYDYYRQHPETETGEKALSSACRMWGNIGEDQYIDEILETLDKDSEVWAKIIQSMGNIYYRSDNRDMESFEILLTDLKTELTDSVSKSAVTLSLLRREEAEDNYDKVKELAEELIELDASPFFVKQGEGYLHEMTSLRVGQEAVNFDAETLEGESISLSKMKGKFVLLDFWATWCGPCIPEIPNLKILSEKYDNDEFEIISISLDRDKKALIKMIEEKGMEWKQVHQEKAWGGKIAELYNVIKLPRKYLINPQGKIVAKDLRGKDMIEEIEKQLSK